MRILHRFAHVFDHECNCYACGISVLVNHDHGLYIAVKLASSTSEGDGSDLMKDQKVSSVQKHSGVWMLPRQGEVYIGMPGHGRVDVQRWGELGDQRPRHEA